jgi:hypothetical protein
MKKSAIVTILFLGFIAYFSITTIWTGSEYKCEVCVKYKGVESCQEVEGMDKMDTMMVGVSTACGAVATGMTESIDCQQTPPTKMVCEKM